MGFKEGKPEFLLTRQDSENSASSVVYQNYFKIF
jgi:hypothetical protein